jgi:hypothetical protein
VIRDFLEYLALASVWVISIAAHGVWRELKAIRKLMEDRRP